MVQAVATASLVAALVYLAAFAAIAVLLALRFAARGGAARGDRQSFLASRFSIPVSLVVPVTGGAPWRDAADTIAALVDLNYPAFEVIAVADDLPASAWDAFRQEWGLEAREIFFRLSLDTAPIRMMYRSAHDPRLIVVHKTAGSPADALNCGVNLARFRYVCAVEPGLVFDRDALLRAMTGPIEDPARIVGATSHVEIRGGFVQRLHSIRSLMDSRLVWRHLQAALGPREAVVVWRRDAVEHAGGFDNVWDPHLDLMVRLQTAMAADAAGQVVRTAEVFGYRRPRTALDHLRHTVRRQQAALRALASWRRVDASTRTMIAYFFASEVVTPCTQAWVIVATTASAAWGWLPWIDVGAAVLLLAAGRASIGAAARLVRGVTLPFEAPGAA